MKKKLAGFNMLVRDGSTTMPKADHYNVEYVEMIKLFKDFVNENSLHDELGEFLMKNQDSYNAIVTGDVIVACMDDDEDDFDDSGMWG